MHPLNVILILLLTGLLTIITLKIFIKPEHPETQITSTTEKTPLANALITFSEDIENKLKESGIENKTYHGLSWFYEYCNINLCNYMPHDISIETTISGNNQHACYEILLTTLDGKRIYNFDNPNNVKNKRIHYWRHQPEYYTSQLCFDIF